MKKSMIAKLQRLMKLKVQRLINLMRLYVTLFNQFSFSPFLFFNNIYLLCSLSFTLLRIDEILDELARENSPDQTPNPSLLNLQPSSPTSQGITHPDDQSSQQVILCFTLYFSRITQSANTFFLFFSLEEHH